MPSVFWATNIYITLNTYAGVQLYLAHVVVVVGQRACDSRVGCLHITKNQEKLKVVPTYIHDFLRYLE